MSDVIPALLLFLLPLAYSPGPGNLFFAALGAQGGLRASLPATFGYHVATFFVTLALGLGFLGVVARLPAVQEALRYGGAAYMLWIATRFWSAGGVASRTGAGQARIWDGAILLLLNPKAYVIIGLMFAQFSPGADFARITLITTLFTLNNLVAFTLWTMLGARLARLFSGALVNRACALLLAGVSLWVLLR